MIKTIFAGMLAAVAIAGLAAPVDVNKATQAELESVKGIGPSMAEKILDERRQGAFKNWQDLIGRVKGIGEGTAAKFSAEGLTVDGAPHPGATPPARK